MTRPFSSGRTANNEPGLPQPHLSLRAGTDRFSDLPGAEEIPHKLLTYLMDLPLPDGYEPVDDNTRPRVRLMKYLWHDGAKPLGERCPRPRKSRAFFLTGTSLW